MYNCKMFHKDFQQQYNSAFYKYFIAIAYGNQVVPAEALLEDKNE